MADVIHYLLPLHKVCHAVRYTEHPPQLVTKVSVSVAVDPRISHATHAHKKRYSKIN